MKEIWAYIKWQHKISGNGLFYIALYSFWGFTIQSLGNDIVSKFLGFLLILAIWSMNFRSLYEKKLKKQELTFPIKNNTRILGVFIYFLMTLLVGIGIAWISMNTYVYFIIIMSIILCEIKMVNSVKKI